MALSSHLQHGVVGVVPERGRVGRLLRHGLHLRHQSLRHRRAVGLEVGANGELGLNKVEGDEEIR